MPNRHRSITVYCKLLKPNASHAGHYFHVMKVDSYRHDSANTFKFLILLFKHCVFPNLKVVHWIKIKIWFINNFHSAKTNDTDPRNFSEIGMVIFSQMLFHDDVDAANHCLRAHTCLKLPFSFMSPPPSITLQKIQKYM